MPSTYSIPKKVKPKQVKKVQLKSSIPDKQAHLATETRQAVKPVNLDLERLSISPASEQQMEPI